MEQLFLHIGHLKTGSSALQVAFARSAPILREHGILYPDHRSTDLAVAGKFTAGNVIVWNFLENYDAARAEIGPDGKVFFSSEGLFDDLDSAESHVATLSERGVSISVLMFLRNPVEFAISTYQQRVQGAGYEGCLEDFLKEFDQLEQVERVLDRMESLGLKVTLRSFDRSRKTLVEEAENWLGLPAQTLERPGTAPVNRSLTRAEQAFLRRLSGHLGVSGSDHVGGALVNGLPNMPRERTALARQSYDDFVSRIAPQVARLNARLPKKLYYAITPYDILCEEPAQDEQYQFSGAQLDVITEALAARVPGPGLVRQYVSWLKACAEGEVLNAERIYMLNQIGQTLRPGQFPAQRMRRLRHLVQKSADNQR